MDTPQKDIKRTVEIEEFTNRSFIHPMSARLVPILHRLDVHPNTVSLTGALCGVLAGLCYYHYENLTATIAGFILMIAWHVMDGADGQLARLSGKVTASGYVIDGICDYVTFIVVYAALATRLSATDGGGIWLVVVAAGLSHIVQSAAFELQRASYGQWAGGKAFAPTVAPRDDRAAYAPLGLLARIYAAVQRPFQPVDQTLRARMLALADRGPDEAMRIAETYRGIFRTAVLRWSWQSANNRTIAIFIACLIGAPILYFLYEVLVLNIGLILLIRLNKQRTAQLAFWLQSQPG